MSPFCWPPWFDDKMTGLEGKVAVVTGASRGIGQSIALDLARHGVNLALLSRSGPEETAEQAQAILSGRNASGAEAKAVAYRVDVSDSGAVSDTFGNVLSDFGRVDFLVNNAGITRDNLILKMKDSEWSEVLDANLTGAFHCLRASARPLMRQRSGKIVNVASVVGLIGNAGQLNYAASKGGLIALTRSAAKEMASRGVTVNAVAPGFIETDMTANLSEPARANLMESIPLGRIGTVEEVSRVVAFLLSDGGNYITGQVIVVDGGMAIG